MRQARFTLLIFTILFVSGLTSHSQNLTGRTVDLSGPTLIPLAGVRIQLKTVDSLVLVQGISDNNGRFILEVPNEGHFVVSFSLIGYDSLFKDIVWPEGRKEYDLSDVPLIRRANELEQVTIQSSPPLVLRRDTVSISARGYHLKPGATVGDLLQKFPGLDIENTSMIRYQGYRVTRVLLDGKRYFGDDPAMILKNIPPEIIDRIEIFDTRGDVEERSGFGISGLDKTLNLILRKDIRNGTFGKVSLGAGSSGRYDGLAFWNRFDRERQYSLFAQSNNNNRQNFSGASDGSSETSGLRDYNNSAGPTRAIGAGMNFRDRLSPSLLVYGSYFYSGQKVLNEISSTTTTVLNMDSTSYRQDFQRIETQSRNHRFSFNAEKKINENTDVIVRGSASIVDVSVANERNANVSSADMVVLSSGNSKNKTTGGGNNLLLESTLRHHSKDGKSNFSIRLNASKGSMDRYAFSNSMNTDFLLTGTRKIATDQYLERIYGTRNLGATISYSRKVSKNSQLELNYNLAADHGSNDRKGLRFDSTSKSYSLPDSLLTNIFKSGNLTNRFQLAYRMEYTKLVLEMNGGLQFSNIYGDNSITSTRIDQHYTNFYPAVSLTYNMAKLRTLRFSYTGRSSQPSSAQLQSVADFTDLYFFSIGNPRLKQSFTHSFNLNYNFYGNRQQGGYISLNAASINNNISTSITTVSTGTVLPKGLPDSVPLGATIMMPVNVSGAYNFGIVSEYSIPLRIPKSKLSFKFELLHTSNTSLQNDPVSSIILSNRVSSTVTTGQVKWGTNINHLDINLSSATSFYQTRYSIMKAFQNSYIFQNNNLEITYYDHGWVLNTTLSHRQYFRKDAGNKGIPLLYASLSRQFLNDRKADLRLSVFDLLGQNQGISRNVGPSYVQDSKSNLLGRYFMLSLNYNFRKLHAVKSNMPN